MFKLISQPNISSIFKVVLPVAIVSSLSFTASADQTPQTPAQIQDQISAQINVTNDSINQLLKKMEEKSQTNDGLKHADYIVKAQHERELAQKALDDFETYLQTSLFVEVHATLVNYNNVYVSNAYTPAQKRQLLTNTASVVSGFFIEASSRYRAALYKVYEAFGPGFGSMLKEVDALYPNYPHAGSEPNDYDGLLGERLSNAKYYDSVIVPSVLNECYSRSCVSDSASDEIAFYTLVRSLFGGPIEFKGLDGTEFILNPRVTWDDSSLIDRHYIGMLSDELDYPTTVKNLPFDIDSTAYAQAVAKNPPKTNEPCKSHWGHKCPN